MQYFKALLRLNNGKFADHNLEKMCPWSRQVLPLASRTVVFKKSVLGQGLSLRFLLSSWLWSRTLRP